MGNWQYPMETRQKVGLLLFGLATVITALELSTGRRNDMFVILAAAFALAVCLVFAPAPPQLPRLEGPSWELKVRQPAALLAEVLQSAPPGAVLHVAGEVTREQARRLRLMPGLDGRPGQDGFRVQLTPEGLTDLLKLLERADLGRDWDEIAVNSGSQVILRSYDHMLDCFLWARQDEAALRAWVQAGILAGYAATKPPAVA